MFAVNPATAEQADGSWDKDINQEFTAKECEIMGPRVTPDTLKALHWYRANHVVTVRNREAVYKYSNENYPIFIRECWFTDSKGNRDCFYKIYEPLNRRNSGVSNTSQPEETTKLH